MKILRQFFEDVRAWRNPINVLVLPYREIIAIGALGYSVVIAFLLIVGVSADFFDSNGIDDWSEWWDIFLTYCFAPLVIWLLARAWHWHVQISTSRKRTYKFSPFELDHGVFIPVSKLKLIIFIILTVMFGVLSAAVVIGATNDLVPPSKTGTAYVAGIAGIIMSVYFAKMLRKILWSDRPGVTIDMKGLRIKLFNAGLLMETFIPWSDISKIEKKGRFICVIPDDPAKYVSKGSWLNRRFTRDNNEFFGTPIYFSTDLLTAKLDHLYECVQAGFGGFQREANDCSSN